MNLAKINEMSDANLLIIYREGNKAAISELVERHKKRVFDHVNIMVRNRELAEDITQDTFIKVLRFIEEDRYTDNGKFIAWVLRIAHNSVIDHFRQSKKHTHITEDDAGYDLLNNKSFSDDTVEDQMITSQIHSDVRKMVECLPEEQREVVMMRYFNNMSFKDISDTTGVSINTALGRMRYALINLRKIMKDKNIILSTN
ncbi:MAG: sigma-70 family RNA polymerase sigma factor [Rikenellaceae bacterium]